MSNPLLAKSTWRGILSCHVDIMLTICRRDKIIYLAIMASRMALKRFRNYTIKESKKFFSLRVFMQQRKIREIWKTLRPVVPVKARSTNVTCTKTEGIECTDQKNKQRNKQKTKTKQNKIKTKTKNKKKNKKTKQNKTKQNKNCNVLNDHSATV